MIPNTHPAPRLSPDNPDWAQFRAAMPVTRNWAYFDHAAVSPLPAVTQEAIVRWAADAAENGDVHWPEWASRLETTRRLGAALIAAEPAEIALIHNTTEGISLVAEGFPWQRGDNVVTLADEFPSNQYPWLNLAARGVETRRVPTDQGRVDLDRIAATCDRRTRIITLSWVGYASGWRNDLPAVAEIARQHGAYFFLDAIQGLGVLPLDARSAGVDFLAADGHKWLLGPEGAGLLYVRREHLDLLRPLGVGWNSVAGSHDFARIDLTFKPSAERYEGGSYNMVGLLGLAASLELLAQYGPADIERRIGYISTLACERLAAAGAVIRSHREPSHASGIVSFDMPGRDPQQLRQHCLRQGVVLSCRGGRLRISPHAYNDEQDVERLVAALATSP